MSEAVPTGVLRNLDPYVAVRAQLIARQWDNAQKPRADWFADLAKAGLTNAMAKSGYSTGLAELLTAAEIFGAYSVPLSLTHATAAAAVLAASSNPEAQTLLSAMTSGGAPVLAVIKGKGKKPRPAGGDSGSLGTVGWLAAVKGSDRTICISGISAAIPDAEEASAFLAGVEGPDGLFVFVFAQESTGVSFTSHTDLTGGTLSTFTFDNYAVPESNILARGSAAQKLLDRAGFAIQLGLAAELSGAGSALLTRAGAAHASERDISTALMDVTLARALVFGAAGLTDPSWPHAAEIIAGAYSAAAQAAINAAKLALAADSDHKHRAAIRRLACRTIVASHLYGAPQNQRQTFTNWRCTTSAGHKVMDDVFAAASAMSGGAETSPSAAIAAINRGNEDLRTLAAKTGVLSAPEFQAQHGAVELDLMALVCADAQQQAGTGPSSEFIAAAARRTQQRLADCAFHAAGTDAALDARSFAADFLAAHDCSAAP